MTKPKLLIFIEYYLPGYKFGGPIQSVVNLVSLLGERYEIFIVTRDRDFGETEAYANVIANQWLAKDGYQIRYVSPGKSHISQIRQLLTERVYDHIYTNSLFAGFTRQLLLISWMTGQKIIVAPRGELHPGALQLKAYKKKPFVWLTRRLPKNRLIWHATDREEVEAIRQHFVDWRVQYAPVRFAPDTPRRSSKRLTLQKQTGRVRLVFISRITRKKGIQFLLELLSRHAQGQVVLDIFGPVVDEAYWRDCEALIRQMPVHCQVTYRGAISHEQVNEALLQYDFFVLPTLGENFGHAIFEALSAGVPVLISDQTPWQNLQAQRAGWSLALTEPGWNAALTESIQMDHQTHAEWSAQAVAVANAYMEEGQFEQSYLSLFS